MEEDHLHAIQLFFSTNGFSYNYVCGKVLGYQKGTPAAFQIDLNRVPSLENLYVDGLSLTHGAPGSRQHIWTFAVALYEQDSSYNSLYNCECTNINYNWPYEVPSFVGNNYFCETGNVGPGSDSSRYYDDLFVGWTGMWLNQHMLPAESTSMVLYLTASTN